MLSPSVVPLCPLFCCYIGIMYYWLHSALFLTLLILAPPTLQAKHTIMLFCVLHDYGWMLRYVYWSQNAERWHSVMWQVWLNGGFLNRNAPDVMVRSLHNFKKNAEWILTLSTINGWERDYDRCIAQSLNLVIARYSCPIHYQIYPLVRDRFPIQNHPPSSYCLQHNKILTHG